MIPPDMTIAKGAALGPYEILSPIGAGGMGEVWRARDRRIGREVAVKVLPDHFDDESVKRFEQEARAAGALSHPGLVTIFDVGSTEGAPYIVMELLEGETLRDVLGDGEPAALPARKAIDIAAQIAAALATAHDKGIIHRDLKPENLFVTSDRRVKILDFGLAKLMADPADPEGSNPTSKHLTGSGIAIGTPAYMSPEQVRAARIDHRTDIFSLGAVLYEMLSGQAAFQCSSAVETMHAVLSDEPVPLETLVPDLSPELDTIVRHCLEKDPRERFQSARDLAFQLRMLPEMRKNRTGNPQPAAAKKRLPLRAAAAVLLVGLAGVAGALALRGLRGPVRQITGPYKQLTFADGVESFPALSPDGKSFAYVTSQRGNRDIYLQRVDGRGAINLTSDSPDDDSEPAFSPDGSQIAFRSERDGGGIFVMGVTGESVIRLTEFGYNPSWSPDGRIVFSTVDTTFNPHYHNHNGDLWIVNVRTTAKHRLFQGWSGASDIAGRVDALQPSWSPHGNRIAFWGVDRSGRRDIWTIEPDAPQPRQTIVCTVSNAALKWNPVWSPTGRHLYFGSQLNGTLNLWRVRIDERTGVAAGEPELVPLPASSAGHYAFSQHGDLAFSAVTRTYRLLALPLDDKTAKVGEPRVLFGASQDLPHFEPSPDRRLMAFTTGPPKEDVFIANIDGTNMRQLTNDDANDRYVTWSPDGKRLYFFSNRGGDYDIWSVHADGSGLTPITNKGTIWNPNVSPDGRMLTVHPAALVYLDRPIERRMEMIDAIIHTPRWSPDGTRLVGGAFTDAGPRIGLALYTLRTKRLEKILDRGFQPAWFPDGRRVLFFENQSIGILDVDTRQVVSSPFTPPPGVRLNESVFPRFARDGSTIYVRQMLEQADVWFVHLEED